MVIKTLTNNYDQSINNHIDNHNEDLERKWACFEAF